MRSARRLLPRRQPLQLRKEAPRAAGQAPAIETDDYDESAAGELAEIEVDDSRIGGPERERRAASETPEESFVTEPPAEVSKDLSNVVVTGPRADAAAEESANSRAPGAPAALASWQRTPEEWYARIVALRKAGSNAEADAELERFEAAWPDWMKQHGKPRP